MPLQKAGDPLAEYWADFWGEPGRAKGGCLAGSEAIAGACRQLWRAFAQRLPKRARVLDLATGDGIVLARMAGARPDLKLFGVDLSPTLPAAPPGVSLRAGVAMETLPFADGRFAAVTSQFGLEYGAVAAAAGEIGRVLCAGGAFQFLIHHGASPVLRQGGQRRAAIEWAAFDGDRIGAARRLAAARRSHPLPTPPAFAAAAEAARRLFPGQPVAAEITAAIADILLRPGNPADAEAALAVIERKARGEIASLHALERAAKDEAGIRDLAATLDAAGLPAQVCRPVEDPESRRPFAWLLLGAKAGG